MTDFDESVRALHELMDATPPEKLYAFDCNGTRIIARMDDHGCLVVPDHVSKELQKR